jgi:S1-C subfamily serine protease
MEREEDDDLYRSEEPGERIWFHPSEIGSLLSHRPHVSDRRRRTRRAPLSALTVPVLAGMVGAALSVAILAVTGALDGREGQRVVERVTDMPVFDLRQPESVTQLAAAVAPAIVGLRIATPAGDRFGSGLVFTSDGHILTNHQLVEKATSIELTAPDGRHHAAHHLGSDPQADLAVLRVPGARWEPAVLGSARALQVGEPAVVVGAPAGPQGSPSVTAGVVAALGEVVETGAQPLYDMIATDATIGSRASGGPLVARNGAVVGITTTLATMGSGDQRLGLVIPIDLARRSAEQLISGRRITYAWLGATGTDLDPQTAKEYGVSAGTLIRKVSLGGPAHRGGLQVQDVVTAVGSSPISSMNELTMLVRRHTPGQEIRLKIVRAGVTKNMKVRLAEQPQGY